jgi:hypothetical protein
MHHHLFFPTLYARFPQTTFVVAGAAGFEPAITGSKPVALPLGYAPKVPKVFAQPSTWNVLVDALEFDRNISPLAIEPQAAIRDRLSRDQQISNPRGMVSIRD